jgi:hypothetical protein
MASWALLTCGVINVQSHEWEMAALGGAMLFLFVAMRTDP